MRRRLLLAALCWGVAGCASQAERGALSAEDSASPREVEADPLASDPYVRRPGGLGGPGAEGPAPRFTRPGELEVGAERRRFVRPLSVGVALVSDERFADAGTVVLELEANLARDAEVRRVIALRGLGGEALDLSELLKLAAAQGHDALLVDVLPGPDGALREGFWLDPARELEQALVAHVVVKDADARFVGPPTFPDVWDRLATAHVRLPLPAQ